uniref:Uncharacterized protein n=1 Tax=Cannabis sativa TaxID=3483 RepID=A0A803QH91_CANSA
MADNKENVHTPHEETTYRPKKELMCSWRPFNSPFEWTTSSRRTQNLGISHEGPRMKNGRPFHNPVGENGARAPTKYIPIVELEKRHLKRRLEEANWLNAELEREATAVRAEVQGNNTQNQPDPRERTTR